MSAQLAFVFPEPAPAWDALAWLERARWLGSWDRWRASTPCYQRFDKHARELTIERARKLNADEAAALLPVIEHAVLNGLCHKRRVWDRPEIGALIVEIRNRILLLSMGRDAPKPKGPRLDPARLPLDALDRLIQRHPDMAVVDQLRAERANRFNLEPSL